MPVASMLRSKLLAAALDVKSMQRALSITLGRVARLARERRGGVQCRPLLQTRSVPAFLPITFFMNYAIICMLKRPRHRTAPPTVAPPAQRYMQRWVSLQTSMSFQWR